MRLIAAFFANHAEVVDDMLDVQGGFWASTTVAPTADAFRCDAIVLCETEPDDIGKEYTLVIEGEGPSGSPLPAFAHPFVVTGPSLFMCLQSVGLPIERGGGYHRYRFRIDGQHELVDVRLAVRLSFT
ncbi:hypothetical protein [Mycolicibacterium phlei]|jgi:hypothetical protein